MPAGRTSSNLHKGNRHVAKFSLASIKKLFDAVRYKTETESAYYAGLIK
jgi:hypothetical protein